jgi:hypothetical protein
MGGRVAVWDSLEHIDGCEEVTALVGRLYGEQAAAALRVIRLTNHTADYGAGSRRLISGRPGGWHEVGDSVNWKVAQPWQD